MDESAAQLPAWVRKRDGSIEAFNADNISAALFAATEALGEPNAFLARELTQSVLFFLAQEDSGDIADAGQIAELAIKVVRELGQAKLAQAFAEAQAKGEPTEVAANPERTIQFPVSTRTSPEEATDICMNEYSLAAIYGRDLAAAHRDGMLNLSGLEAPQKLLGRVCEFGANESHCTSAEGLADCCWQAIVRSGREACRFTALDGLEHSLARLRAAPDEIAHVLATIKDAAEFARLSVVIHLNCAEPPAWANQPNSGPLFADAQDGNADVRTVLAVLPHLLGPELLRGCFHVDWHIRQTDIDGGVLSDILGRAAGNANLSLSFDRPRKAIALGEGLDRTHPAALLAVDMNLACLLRQNLGDRQLPTFLEKLETLAHMAVSAAVQKRRYLREHQPALAQGFLLDRARLIATPIGFHEVARQLATHGVQAVDAGRQIVAALTTQFRRIGAAANLDVALDASRFLLTSSDEQPRTAADLKDQLRLTAALYAGSGGTAALNIASAALTADELLSLVCYAWQRSDVARLFFVCS